MYTGTKAFALAPVRDASEWDMFLYIANNRVKVNVCSSLLEQCFCVKIQS